MARGNNGSIDWLILHNRAVRFHLVEVVVEHAFYSAQTAHPIGCREECLALKENLYGDGYISKVVLWMDLLFNRYVHDLFNPIHTGAGR